MPAVLTHWFILIETARQSQDAGSDLGSLIVDANTLRRRNHGWSTLPQTVPNSAVWDTGPLPEIDFRFPGSDISAMAFLGALAPDIMYYHKRYRKRYFHEKLTDASFRGADSQSENVNETRQWSDLFHSMRSGDLLIAFLEQIALVPSPALRTQALAFALGYVSHIAVDIALNPWINALAAELKPHRGLGPRRHVALRLDEYLATHYFEHPRHSLLYQPWGRYIEPAARNLSQPDTLAHQILQLLAIATEIYQLEEERVEALPDDFLAGLKGLRSFLAGRGSSRWLALQMSRSTRSREWPDDILTLRPRNKDMPTLDKVLSYATSLSERLCRQAIDYYSALRNQHSEARARSSRRSLLLSDLRNWNLDTGYSTDQMPGGSDSTPVNNWAYFSSLWEPGGESREQSNSANQTGPLDEPWITGQTTKARGEVVEDSIS